MNYIDQLNAFGAKSAGVLSPGATALYVRLFLLNNQHHWAEYFPASLSLLQALTKTGSINTIRTWQAELESLGFVECRKGGHKKPNLYKLHKLYVSMSDIKTDTKVDTKTDIKTDIKTDSIKEEEVKEDKKKSVSHSKKTAPSKIKYAEAVSMTNDEYSSLMEKLGSEQAVTWCIEKLNNYKLSSGKKYKSDYRAILNWVIGEYEKQGRPCDGGAISASHSTSSYADFLAEQKRRRLEQEERDKRIAALARGQDNG